MRGLLVIALCVSISHAMAKPAHFNEKSFASMLLATQPAHGNLNQQAGTQPAPEHVRAGVSGMMDPEEFASFRAWLASSETASSARLQEAPAPTRESSGARAVREFAQQAWKAHRGGGYYQHDDAAKQEWLSQRSGNAWSKGKKNEPTFKSFPAPASKPKPFVDEFAQQAWMAKRGGNYEEVAKQEWLAKRAGKIWSKDKKTEPVLETPSAPTSKPKPYVDEFSQQAWMAKRGGNYEEVAKQKWLAKRAGKIWSKEKKTEPALETPSAPASKPKPYSDEFAQQAWMAKRGGNYEEVAKQEWLAKRSGKIWSIKKKTAPTEKSLTAPASKPKPYVDEFAQQAWMAKREGKYDEVAKQEWLAKRAGPVWSKEKKDAPIFKVLPAPAPAPKKQNLYKVDEIAKQAWMAKREGNYDEVVKQEWLAKRAGSRTE